MEYRRIAIACIGCGTPMAEWRSERGVPMDLCEQCGGVWMDTADFLAVLREHQPRIAHHREQHLANGLGLPGIEALRGRPVAWQADIADALEV